MWNDLECRSHLLGIPKGIKFVAEMLKEIFALNEPPLLARAHRTLVAKPTEGQRPRVFVICHLLSLIRCQRSSFAESHPSKAA